MFHKKVKYSIWIMLLNCGPYLEATVMLVFLIALRSLSASHPRVSRTGRPAGERAALICLGIVLGLATSLAWWHVFVFACKYSGLDDYIIYIRGGLGGGISFYSLFSVFIAIYLGIFAGDLA